MAVDSYQHIKLELELVYVYFGGSIFFAAMI
jgi:hypothetical protein